MARPLRIQYPYAWYHVMNGGIRGERVFEKKEDYLAFIDLLKDIGDMWNARVAAYCLMTGHYHLLIQTPDANLSRCMRHIWPSVIGSAGFVEGIKNKFFTKKRHEEIPESRFLAPDVSTLKKRVCRLYGVSEGELLVSKRGVRNEARNVAIYLQRRLSGSKLKEIGDEFGIRSYSTVSTIIERTKEEVTKDSRLRKRIEQLRHELEMSQEQNDPMTIAITPVLNQGYRPHAGAGKSGV